MKNLLFGVLILVFGLSFASSAYAQEVSASKDKKEVVKEQSGIFNTVCPVSGEEIDSEKTYTYNGVTYALCCNTCLKKFKANPEKYISKLSEDGKSLKKKK